MSKNKEIMYKLGNDKQVISQSTSSRRADFDVFKSNREHQRELAEKKVESYAQISSNVPDQKQKNYLKEQKALKKYIYEKKEADNKKLKIIFHNLYKQANSIGKEALGYLKEQEISTTSLDEDIKEHRETCSNLYQKHNKFEQNRIYNKEEALDILKPLDLYQKKITQVARCALLHMEGPLKLNESRPDREKLIQFIQQIEDTFSQPQIEIEISETESSSSTESLSDSERVIARDTATSSHINGYQERFYTKNSNILLKEVMKRRWESYSLKFDEILQPGYYLKHQDGHKAFIPSNMGHKRDAFLEAVKDFAPISKASFTDVIDGRTQETFSKWSMDCTVLREPVEIYNPSTKEWCKVEREFSAIQNFYDENIKNLKKEHHINYDTFKLLVNGGDFDTNSSHVGKKGEARGWLRNTEQDLLLPRHIVVWRNE